jgi:environmental stress-induced protein Ves
MLLLRAADRTAIPWKNGGGVTRDVLISPAGAMLDAFDWRISIAEIASDGAFSRFPGIDRKLAVLDGKVALTVDGHAQITLDSHSPVLDFPGEAAVEGHPIGGPSTDLNVMTWRGRFVARMARQSTARPKIGAHTTVVVALTPLTATGPEDYIHMERHDALLIQGSETLTVAPKGVAYYLIEIDLSQP